MEKGGKLEGLNGIINVSRQTAQNVTLNRQKKLYFTVNRSFSSVALGS